MKETNLIKCMLIAFFLVCSV